MTKTCPRIRRTANTEWLQSIQDGHLKLSSTSWDQGDLKSVVGEVNVKLLIALLEDKGMMEFLPALLCLITMDLKTWALTNGWR